MADAAATGNRVSFKTRGSFVSPEERQIAAVSDRRLVGRDEEVYYLLRGLGMRSAAPKAQEQQQIPRIEVSSVHQPALFNALRRLGFRPEGRKIIVEPRTAAEPADAASRLAPPPAPLLGHPLEELCFVPSKFARQLGKEVLKPRKMPRKGTQKDVDAAVARVAKLKAAQKSSHVMQSISYATHVERWPPPEPQRREPAPAPEEATTLSVGHERGRVVFEPAQEPPAWWTMTPGKTRHRTDQIHYTDKLALPKKPKRVASAPGSLHCTANESSPWTRSQTSFGLAAHRSLCERLAAVQAAGGYPWQLRADDAVRAADAEAESPDVTVAEVEWYLSQLGHRDETV